MRAWPPPMRRDSHLSCPSCHAPQVEEMLQHLDSKREEWANLPLGEKVALLKASGALRWCPLPEPHTARRCCPRPACPPPPHAQEMWPCWNHNMAAPA